MSKEQERDARQAAYRSAHRFLVTGALFALVIWTMVDNLIATGDVLWRYALAVLILGSWYSAVPFGSASVPGPDKRSR